ncbi:Lrp/AsnC family transcriptional regulator [Galactobacter caseinivorans]|uniref:Lrp/AsnC family transcriptional regulator n=1 Tax=Galactobacter caseinivorans TaxID=2676123 RepID=A0A496PIA8_9MICC|nr:Lrp/AsnC family transcriptional regulator [Galactobacter caseinivorans]RKW70219.1 Lrp/AsnC family transcriptional regulator [Galactobacter caseinivorans]
MSHPPAPHSGSELAFVDTTNKAIIEQLQEDGRRSYSAIGKAVGLSEAATRQRVQRLIEAQVIQVVAVTDPTQLGFARQAMIGIRTRGDMRAAADLIAQFPEVDYCVVVAGHYDVLAEVVASDDQDLLRIINHIRSVDQVESTETLLYLSLRKQTYNWGTR